jgi:hypothetical protein
MSAILPVDCMQSLTRPMRARCLVGEILPSANFFGLALALLAVTIWCIRKRLN